MLKHMKYELKKSLFSKIVILIVTAIAEITFLIGVFSKHNTPLAWGIAGLSICAWVGIFYIGIESLITFHRDLNTKQSYMLFMTPYNSYTILGAKVLQNALAIFAAGLFFGLLACLDGVVATIYLDGLQQLIKIVQETLRQIGITVHIHAQNIVLAVALVLISWLLMIVIGYFAIILSATFLSGKKGSGLVSLVIYFIINGVWSFVLNRVPEMKTEYAQIWLMIGISAIFVAVIYAVSGWIMEKRLSV